MKNTIMFAALTLACSTAFASSSSQPKIDINQALSTAEKAGYKDIRKIELEHGKWEIKGRNAHHKKYKIKIDATTGELSKDKK